MGGKWFVREVANSIRLYPLLILIYFICLVKLGDENIHWLGLTQVCAKLEFTSLQSLTSVQSDIVLQP